MTELHTLKFAEMVARLLRGIVNALDEWLIAARKS